VSLLFLFSALVSVGFFGFTLRVLHRLDEAEAFNHALRKRCARLFSVLDSGCHSASCTRFRAMRNTATVRAGHWVQCTCHLRDVINTEAMASQEGQ
jgi:hypothetical protein